MPEIKSIAELGDEMRKNMALIITALNVEKSAISTQMAILNTKVAQLEARLSFLYLIVILGFLFFFGLACTAFLFYYQTIRPSSPLPVP